MAIRPATIAHALQRDGTIHVPIVDLNRDGKPVTLSVNIK